METVSERHTATDPNELVPVVQIEYQGCSLFAPTVKEAMVYLGADLEADLERISQEEVVDPFTVRVVLKTAKELDSLPEWNGW